ncbi:MAG TPA: hypothetical protein VF384_10295 [Planctomycetota bacterium]
MLDQPRLPRRVALAAIGVACSLTALHSSLELSYRIRHLASIETRSWFDMRCDYGIPACFAFLCYAAAGVACFGWGRAIRSVPIMLTGVLFVLLMIDDVFMLHERVGSYFWAVMESTGVYSWVLVLGLPLAAAGLAAFRACQRHLASYRSARLRLLTGFACLGVAVAIEAVEVQTTNSGIRLRGIDLVVYLQTVEEFLELLGPLLVAWSAAEAWQRATSKPLIAKS